MNLVDTLKKTLSVNQTNVNSLPGNSPLNFIKSKKAVLKELSLAKDSGLLIGVYSRALGEGMFIVGVSNIETDGPVEVAVFETYDQTGSILNRTRLSIDEIKMVFPFDKKYVNPVLNKLEFA
jgi:hypothetical protein